MWGACLAACRFGFYLLRVSLTSQSKRHFAKGRTTLLQGHTPGGRWEVAGPSVGVVLGQELCDLPCLTNPHSLCPGPWLSNSPLSKPQPFPPMSRSACGFGPCFALNTDPACPFTCLLSTQNLPVPPATVLPFFLVDVARSSWSTSLPLLSQNRKDVGLNRGF